MLRLLLLLLAWLLPGRSQDPQAACGPDGCYAAYLQRRTFLEAWHGCRELGGNLATLKRAEDAAQVAQLLRSDASTAAVEHGPRLFWIGLHRQPRQCFPGRPLRGFTWTTGDQDTAYTNWARAAAAGVAGGSGGPSCTAPRCVVLDDRDLQWLDGACTVPVDGYLCHFAFRGMCPGLAEEQSGGAGAVVTYSTPFGTAGGSLRYVPFGTVAAVACGGAGPAVSLLCLQKEDGTVAWSKDGPLCREDVYQHSWCEGDNGGCQQLCLDEGSGYSCECHAGYFLMPDGHSCSADDACRDRPCQFGCVSLDDSEGGYQCQCPAGFELGPDGHQCHDVDECLLEAPCDHQCENTEGSFVCRCHLGFSPSDEDDPGQCVDTDECQIPGVCQQMCVNYVGGFECYCTEGYELEPDSISCSPLAQLPPLATPGSPLDPAVDPGRLTEHRGHSLTPWDRLSPVRTAFMVPPSSAPPTDAQGTPSPEHLDLSPAPLNASSPALDIPSPTVTAPHLSTATSDSPQLPTDPPSTPTHPAGEREPGSPWMPFAPTVIPPLPVTDSSGGEQGAVVGGVRALLPTLATPSPASEEALGRQPRDDRWLLVALVVPLCVFLVVMLALGIVYCTRCGAQAKTRSVTQCYRWVINSAGKGAPPPSSRPWQPATCRTSV